MPSHFYAHKVFISPWFHDFASVCFLLCGNIFQAYLRFSSRYFYDSFDTFVPTHVRGLHHFWDTEYRLSRNSTTATARNIFCSLLRLLLYTDLLPSMPYLYVHSHHTSLNRGYSPHGQLPLLGLLSPAFSCISSFKLYFHRFTPLLSYKCPAATPLLH